MKPGDIMRLTRDVVRQVPHTKGTRVTIDKVFQFDKFDGEYRTLVNAYDWNGTLILNIPDTTLEPYE